MLRLENISLSVGDEQNGLREILNNITLEFESGRLYAITGPNGGGKTSLAKVIMGIYSVSSGKISFKGEDITNASVTERANKGISYAFQQPPRFKGLQIFDLLQIAQPGIDSISLRKNLRDVGLCPEDYQERDVGSGLSGGEMKRIEIAQILARNSSLSIFDEPEAGVDLWTIQKILSIIINRYKQHRDMAAIMITHNEKLLPICDEIIVLEEGMVKQQGTASEVWPSIKFDIQCKMRDLCQAEV